MADAWARAAAAILAAALLALIATNAARAESPALTAGVIVEAGYAFALDPATGDWNPVQPVDALSEGAQIGTGPDTRLVLTFPDGSVMQIESDTHVALVEIASDNIVVYQFHGNTWARAAGTVETVMKIETPSGFLIATDAELKSTVHPDGGLEVKITGGQADLAANGDPYGTSMNTGDFVQAGAGNQPTVDVLELVEVEVVSLSALREQVPPPVESLEITVETVVMEEEEVAEAVAAMTGSTDPEVETAVEPVAEPAVATSAEPVAEPTPEPAPALTEDEALAIRDAAISAAAAERNATRTAARETRDGVIDSADDIRDAALDAADATRDAAVDAAKVVKDAELDAAKSIKDKDDRKAAKAAANDKYDAAETAADAIYDAAELAADDSFDTAETAARSAYDAAVAAANTLCDEQVAAATAAFELLLPAA
jgi:hypothetical protein